MMTYFALREDWPVRAAAVWGGITDLADQLKAKDAEARLATSIWADYAVKKDEIQASRSAIRWPDKIHKPILIRHRGERQGCLAAPPGTRPERIDRESQPL